METTPKNGHETGSGTPKPSENARSRKARPPVEIDLPAESVSEVKADPATESPREPTPPEQPPVEAQPASARPSMILPIGLALLAGMAGSLGVQALLGGTDTKLASAVDQRLARLEQARPAAPSLPPELAERLARAEKALADAAPREQALQAEIGRLSAALKTLSERPAPTGAGAPAAENAAEIERLRAAVDTAAKQSETQTARIAALSDQMATLAKSAGNPGSDLARASAGAVVSQNLAESLQRSEPLGAAIDAMKALGVGADRLAPLAAFAQSPPPSLASLAAELRDLAKASTDVGNGQPADFFTRLKQGAASLVEVRRTGEITGTDDAAHLARAEQAVNRGDLATALTLVGRLSAPRAERFAGWKAKAEARAKADEAIRQIRQESLAALARVAGPAKP